MNETRTLGQIAKFLRSKNAGPFNLTLDIFFYNTEDYEKAKSSGVINKELISRLYHIDIDDINIIEFDPAAAIKISFPRRIPSGSVKDSDIYGAQQHAPLFDIKIPW
ncbi:MAG: DUF4387 domain-containing protein [Gammaproteobacteria bacterium]|nr:DUF4387 domain-containing protein [Gammaproteobacteria bacterium]